MGFSGDFSASLESRRAKIKKRNFSWLRSPLLKFRIFFDLFYLKSSQYAARV